MARSRELVEPVSFEALVAYGISAGAVLINGMPWAFSYKDCPVTHENDDLYLISTPAGVALKFGRKDVLFTGSDGILVCDSGLFWEISNHTLNRR